MSKKASPTLIGIFTLVGLLLAGGALILFGAGKLFEKSSYVILYFDQSANGLLVGSEVRFGGVRIGRVTSIQVLIDPKANRKIIPVVVQLSEKDLKDIGTTFGNPINFASESGVNEAVANGLRAKMKQQSLLTGQLYVEFDIVPNAEGFIYLPNKKSIYPAIPTMSTELDELIAGVAEGLKKFNALQLDRALADLQQVMTTAKNQIAALNLKALNDNFISITNDIRSLTSNEKLTKSIDSLDVALAGIVTLTTKANEKMPLLIDDLEKMVHQTNAGLVKINQATTDIAKLTNPRAPTLLRAQHMLEELEQASRAFKELANDLKRNPDALLRGKAATP